MPKIKVELESPGMAALLNSKEVRDHLTSRMERALSYAKANSPFDEGEYVSEHRVVQDSTDRAVVRLVNAAPHAMVVEARLGVLANALSAASGDADPLKIKKKYTTKDGRTIWATQAQIDNWTRGRQ